MDATTGLIDALEEAVERTATWAARCKSAHQEREGLGTDGPQMLLGIVQGLERRGCSPQTPAPGG